MATNMHNTGILGTALRPATVGLQLFADTLGQQGADVIKVDWRPAPVEAQAALRTLSRFLPTIRAANDVVADRLQTSRPVVLGVSRAGDVVDGLDDRTILHAGPPIDWDTMCGPLRGAVIGALIYEGIASSPDEAERIASGGGIRFSPCHENGMVGPMAGVVSASMPVWVAEDVAHGKRGLCTLNEGLGKTLRHGAFDATVIARLKWMERVLAPVLTSVLAGLDEPLDIRSLAANALQMGDECHNRLKATTSLLLRGLLTGIVRSNMPHSDIEAAVTFMNMNDHFGLNVIMAGAKATADGAAEVENSSIVTTMARNGTDFGLRLAGTGKTWYTGPAGEIEGLFLPGFTPADANPDIGDSTITETVGLGGFALAAAPAIVKFIGGRATEGVERTKAMYDITWQESTSYLIPALEFRGSPVGIDALEVVHTGVVPVFNTGIAGKQAGVGQVGAGIVTPPMSAFVDAVRGLAAEMAA